MPHQALDKNCIRAIYTSLKFVSPLQRSAYLPRYQLAHPSIQPAEYYKPIQSILKFQFMLIKMNLFEFNFEIPHFIEYSCSLSLGWISTLLQIKMIRGHFKLKHQRWHDEFYRFFNFISCFIFNLFECFLLSFYCFANFQVFK